MNETIGRCHDCTAPQTETNMLSRHILELQKDKGDLIDKCRVLEDKLANADYQLEGRDLEIKELQEENENLRSIAEHQQSSNMKRHFEIEELKKQIEELKSKEYFVGDINRQNMELQQKLEVKENRIAALEEQIEKMKCCGNCKLNYTQNGEEYCCDICENYDKWELAE